MNNHSRSHMQNRFDIAGGLTLILHGSRTSHKTRSKLFNDKKSLARSLAQG